MEIKVLFKNRILVAAVSSDEGKTTITCGLLGSLINKGYSVSSFKLYSDHLDCKYHEMLGRCEASNLDPFLLDEQSVEKKIEESASKSDFLVVEGAMGYYDGIDGEHGNFCEVLKSGINGSSYEFAEKYGFPVVLVINGRFSSNSLSCIVKGVNEFRTKSNIVGVILNKISKNSYLYLKNSIEKECGIKVFGYLPYDEHYYFESNDLGLVSPNECRNFQEKMNYLIDVFSKTVDLDSIIDIMKNTGSSYYIKSKSIKTIIKVGIAYDSAFEFKDFNFINILKEKGADILYFSPLFDKYIPECDIYIFGECNIENYALQLSKNNILKDKMKDILLSGKACIAYGGGFTYLFDYFMDNNGIKHKMLSLIPGYTYIKKGTGKFGYINVTCEKENFLAKKNMVLKGQEFRLYESENLGNSFKVFNTLTGEIYYAGFVNWNVVAFPFKIVFNDSMVDRIVSMMKI